MRSKSRKNLVNEVFEDAAQRKYDQEQKRERAERVLAEDLEKVQDEQEK